MDCVWVLAMNNLDKIEHMNVLLDRYGALLTEAQHSILSDYYKFNLSITEISDNRKISRAAVGDAIKVSEKKLCEFEDKLHCVSNSINAISLLEQLKCAEGKNKALLMEKLRELLENGI